MGYMLKKEDNGTGEPEDLARVIDKLLADGSGRLTVDLDDMQNGITFTTTKTTDCGRLGACAQPTEDIDEQEGDDLK